MVMRAMLPAGSGPGAGFPEASRYSTFRTNGGMPEKSTAPVAVRVPPVIVKLPVAVPVIDTEPPVLSGVATRTVGEAVLPFDTATLHAAPVIWRDLQTQASLYVKDVEVPEFVALVESRGVELPHCTVEPVAHAVQFTFWQYVPPYPG